MKRVEIKPQDSIEEIRVAMRRTKDGRYRFRLAVIERIMSKPKVEYSKIAEELVLGRNTITKYVKLYNKGGKQALKDIPTGGRKDGNPKWDNKIFEELSKEIDKQKEYWSVPKMSEWIMKNYSLKIPLSTIDSKMRRKGYSYKSSRPTPIKSDKEKQEKFKKKG